MLQGRLSAAMLTDGTTFVSKQRTTPETVNRHYLRGFRDGFVAALVVSLIATAFLT